MVRRSLLVAVAGVALAALACDDPYAPRPQFPVTSDTLSVFAMTGTSPALPSALHLLQFQPVRLEAGASFDVAFDINEAGNVVVYPALLITSSNLRVGLRDTAAAFETVTAAPRGVYAAEDSLVLTPPRTVIVEAQNPACGFSFSPFIYSKFAVDSVNAERRQIYLRVTVDPNCGFRSFEEGIPRN